MSSDKALEALRRREYACALALLEADLAVRPDGELHALAGLASFQLECYDHAVGTTRRRSNLMTSAASGAKCATSHRPTPTPV
jgi:hypothetical protein